MSDSFSANKMDGRQDWLKIYQSITKFHRSILYIFIYFRKKYCPCYSTVLLCKTVTVTEFVSTNKTYDELSDCQTAGVAVNGAVLV